MLTPEEIADAIPYNTGQAESGALTRDHIDYLLALGAAAFQEEQGLYVDGQAGPKTQEALDKVLSPPFQPVPAGIPSGKGMFVRSLSHAGTPEEMVATMQANGLTWVCVQRLWQYEEKDTKLLNSGDQMKSYADAVHQAGLGFWVWGYPVPGKENEFVDTLFDAFDYAEAQGVIIDPEIEYKDTEGTGTTLMTKMLMEAGQRGTFVGVSSFGAPWNFKTFPWAEFACAHFGVPQIYDSKNTQGLDYGRRSTEAWMEHGFRVVIPASAAYNKTQDQAAILLSGTPTNQGAIIWWDWYNATENPDLWPVIRDFEPNICRHPDRGPAGLRDVGVVG